MLKDKISFTFKDYRINNLIHYRTFIKKANFDILAQLLKNAPVCFCSVT